MYYSFNYLNTYNARHMQLNFITSESINYFTNWEKILEVVENLSFDNLEHIQIWMYNIGRWVLVFG